MRLKDAYLGQCERESNLKQNKSAFDDCRSEASKLLGRGFRLTVHDFLEVEAMMMKDRLRK